MIHQILLFEKKTGIILYDKSITKCGDSPLKEGYGMFFMGLQQLIGELLVCGKPCLKNIDLGDYSLEYIGITDLNSDLVIISDKKDKRKISRLIPQLVKYLLSQKVLFDELYESGCITSFKKMKVPIDDLLVKFKIIEENEQFDWFMFH